MLNLLFLTTLLFGVKENVAFSPPQPPAFNSPDNNAESEAAMDNIWRANAQYIEAGNVDSNSGHPIIEGDIIQTPTLKSQMEKAKKNEPGFKFDAINARRWTNNVMPYTLANSLDAQSRTVILQAMQHITKHSCITFKRWNGEADYVEFFKGNGCNSMIGPQGGKQRVSMGNQCWYIGTAIHEIMHALGFYHEQSRRDRDQYIKIYYNRIQNYFKFAFNKYREGEASTLGYGYDKQSVMHYGNWAFSTTRQKTIESLSNPGEKLGNTQLSDIDKKQLNKYYKCNDELKTTAHPPVVGECKDKSDACSCAKAEWCQATVVQQDCRKTCGLCPIQPPPTTTIAPPPPNCENNPEVQWCSHWAKNYCSSNEYVKTNCKKSCNLC